MNLDSIDNAAMMIIQIIERGLNRRSRNATRYRERVIFTRARILERTQLNNWSRTIKSQSPLIAALTINIAEQTSLVVLRARLFISPFRAIANLDNQRGLMAFQHVINRTLHILTRANKYFQRDRRISEGNLRQSCIRPNLSPARTRK